MRLLRKLGNLIGRRARLRRLEEEMRTHFEMMIEEGERSGLSPAEARRRTQLAFGNTLALREETEDALGWPVLEAFWQDLRLAWRSLVRRPAFTLSIVAILALGIGATGAIATLVRGVYFAPLPVPHPEEIHLVAQAPDHRPKLLSAPTVRRLAEDPAFRGGIAGYSDVTGAALISDDKPAEALAVQFVTGDFFRALGVAPELGRMLDAADDSTAESNSVAVLSWSLWQRRFGGAADVVGRVLRLNGVPVTVVGVAPKQWRGVALGDEVDFWMPLGLVPPLRLAPSHWSISEDGPIPPAEWGRDDRVSWLNVLLRLPPGARVAAEGALAAAWRPHLSRIEAALDDPEERANYGKRVPRIVPAPQGYSWLRDSFRRASFTLSLLVGAVVLVTTANSATLLLLRMLTRTRELGVRLALGAGRMRLACGALLEGVLLAFGGVSLGAVLAGWLTPQLAHWLVPAVEDEIGVDRGLLVLLGAVALATGLVLGVVPAWVGARLDPQAALQRSWGGARGSLRVGRVLVVCQLGLSVVLIALAGALALDLRRTLQASYGFAREAVLTTRVDLATAGIGSERQTAVLERLRAAALELPQVQSVGFAAGGPLSGSQSRSRIYFRGAGAQAFTEGTQHESVDPDYFATIGTPLLRGRSFLTTDTAARPRVAVLSQSLARAAFGEADPIGRRFGFGPEADAEDWEIVGVMADARVNSVHEPAPALFYTPLAQWRNEARYLAVRIAGDPMLVRKALATKIATAEPTLLFSDWLTLEERIERGVRNDVATARLTAGFGLLATVLAGIGVFGALGYLVTTRSHAIAVRLAIGAEPGVVWRGVVREALQLGVLGAGIGGAVAWLLPHWLGSWMLAELRLDWFAVGCAVVVGVLAAVLGGLRPARRAARIDPLVLLKSE
ncbi:MAG: ABC transporter permease [Opitutaceae bacterium]